MVVYTWIPALRRLCQEDQDQPRLHSETLPREEEREREKGGEERKKIMQDLLRNKKMWLTLKGKKAA
jgi:hypothetical protein